MRNEALPGGGGRASGIGLPVTYRMGMGLRVVCALLALVFLATAAGLVWAMQDNYRAGKSDLETMVLFAVVGVAMLAPLVVVPASAVWTEVTLTRDAIAMRRFGTRSMLRRNLAGWRAPLNTKGAWVLVDTQGKNLTLPSDIRFDDRLRAWLGESPDLNAREQRAILDGLMADRSLGADVKERTVKLAQAQRMGKVLNGVTLVLVGWLMLFPRPYDLAVFANLLWPWVGVLLIISSRGLIQLDGKVNDPRPNLGGALILPPIMLALRAMLDVELVDPWRAIGWGVVAGLPLFFVLLRGVTSEAALRGRLVLGAAVLLFAACYGGGALVLLNARFDSQMARVSPVSVVGKHASSGKHTTYYVDVSGWPGYGSGHSFRVSHDDYDIVNKGDRLCALEHPGAFGLGWLDLASCPSGEDP